MQDTQPNMAVTVWDVFAERFYFWFDDVFITQADYFDNHTTHPFTELGFKEETYTTDDGNAQLALIKELPFTETLIGLQKANVRLDLHSN